MSTGDDRSRALERRISELESRALEKAEIEQELLEQKTLLEQQNVDLVRKSLDFSDVKRDFEDRNLEIEAARAELKRQNINLVRKSIELSDLMRELEDRNYDLVRSKRDLEETLEALHESRERFRSLIESTSDWVWEMDGDAVYTYASPKVEDLLGYEPEEIIGTSAFELMTSSDGERAAEVFSRAVTDGTPLERLEYTSIHKDGRHVVLETSGVPIVSAAGDVVGFRGIDRDITERKLLEAQLFHAKKMEAIGQLAGGVAHDFNNLLSPILANVEMLLLDCEPDDPRHEDLTQIERAALRGRDLTSQILAFSRRQVLETKVVSLPEVVSGFVKTLRRTIREDIDLHTSFGPGSGLARADVAQIEQIIMNLAVNSQDAMPNGGKITIAVSDVDLDDAFVEAHPGSKRGPTVRLDFSDTGCGMESEVVKRVYEPFFTTKEKGRGTGLGLATVYGIVKQHGGYISAHSVLGEGATFSVHLPREAYRAEAAPEVSTRRESSAVGKILVVEDDEMVREVVCKVLRSKGFSVSVADDPVSCIELVEQGGQSFHVLLTDVVMPKMNGKELYLRLLDMIPDLRVLYMSGYPEDVIATHGILDDGTNFIQKPISVQTLISMVQEALWD